MRRPIEVHLGDGQRLHLPHVSELFDLVADGLADENARVSIDGRGAQRLGDMPSLKWALTWARRHPEYYAAYELGVDSGDEDRDVLEDSLDEDSPYVSLDMSAHP